MRIICLSSLFLALALVAVGGLIAVASRTSPEGGFITFPAGMGLVGLGVLLSLGALWELRRKSD